MAKEVQLRGSGRAEQDQFIGAERELTVDTDGDELRLHDGVTMGGFRFLNLDGNNLRYQARNDDLTAITQLADNVPGIIVKRGPNNFAVRQITVNPDHLTIGDGNGLNGNPLIGLATTIADAHTFSGVITFSQELVASGGVNGNVTGNLTGNTSGTHTGPVTGNVTGDLTGNVTGNTTGNHVGSVDVRGATLQLDNDQIPLTAVADNATIIRADDPRIAMVNEIKLWFGTPAELRTGWHICDGTNGTPDMRDRFPLGAAEGGIGGPAPNSTGGSATHGHGPATTSSAGAHTPVVTVQGHVLNVDQIPPHAHLQGVSTENSTAAQFGGDTSTATRRTDDDSGAGDIQPRTQSVGGGLAHAHGATAAPVAAHDHTVTVADADNTPPYRALYFIMYTGV